MNRIDTAKALAHIRKTVAKAALTAGQSPTPEPEERTPTLAEAAEFFRTQMHQTVEVFAMQHNGKDVGGMLVIDGELNALRVEEEYRTLGIASALINMAKAHYPKLTLTCTAELIPFYEGHGFILEGPHPPTMHRMEWMP